MLQHEERRREPKARSRVLLLALVLLGVGGMGGGLASPDWANGTRV